MQRKRRLILIAVCATVAVVAATWWSTRHSQPSSTLGSEAKLDHGRFQHFTVYAPKGTPMGFVLLLSDADGWTQAMTDIGRHLAGQGAMVAGIDLTQLKASLEADGASCVFPDGDLENLSHFVQAYYRLPTYLPPILAGKSSGGTLAYATLAQSPTGTFGGAVSLEFCPSLALRKPLCKSAGLDFTPRAQDDGVDLLPAKQLSDPWVVLKDPQLSPPPAHGCDAASVSQFVAQVPNAQLITVSSGGADPSAASPWLPQYAGVFETLMTRNAPPEMTLAPQALSDLPLITVVPQPGAVPSDAFAIMLSGDGGWAGIDKDVAAALSAAGVTVIGLDSLRYFWGARTPQGLATDLDRMIRYYMAQLHKQRVLLIGYSQGADVLPFAVNRLTDATRSHVVLAAIMGMSEHALFEFHMTSWISDDNSGPATLPEVDRITGIPVLCVYGDQETDSLCPKLDPRKFLILKLSGGHHFDGNYSGLAGTIIASARRTSPSG